MLSETEQRKASRARELTADGLERWAVLERLGLTGAELSKILYASRDTTTQRVVCPCGRKTRGQTKCYVCRGWPINRAQFKRWHELPGVVASVDATRVVVATTQRTRLNCTGWIVFGKHKVAAKIKTAHQQAVVFIYAYAGHLRVGARVKLLVHYTPTGAITSRARRPLSGMGF